jgi:hypothetical protein
MAMQAITLYASACGGELTPGVELCSSIAGLPWLFANFMCPFQSSDSFTTG